MQWRKTTKQSFLLCFQVDLSFLPKKVDSLLFSFYVNGCFFIRLWRHSRLGAWKFSDFQNVKGARCKVNLVKHIPKLHLRKF